MMGNKYDEAYTPCKYSVETLQEAKNGYGTAMLASCEYREAYVGRPNEHSEEYIEFYGPANIPLKEVGSIDVVEDTTATIDSHLLHWHMHDGSTIVTGPADIKGLGQWE